MKVLITGGKGQLGVDVTSYFLKSGHQVWSYGKDELDVTSFSQVQAVIEEVMPDLVIHTAAYTKVDQAELDVDSAFHVNAIGTRNVAVSAESVKAKLVYISTDYVFDGMQQIPYNEFSQTNPQSVYGKSKLAGEKYVEQLTSRFFIVRTSWVFGQHGQNFVKTMLRLGDTNQELSVVYDQIGCPTYSADLASFLIQLAPTELYGVYHISNTGYCSWYEFAKAIFEEVGNNHITIKPVTSEQYSRPAPRPSFSVLDQMAVRLNGFQPLRHWREALSSFIEEREKRENLRL